MRVGTAHGLWRAAIQLTFCFFIWFASAGKALRD